MFHKNCWKRKERTKEMFYNIWFSDMIFIEKKKKDV